MELARAFPRDFASLEGIFEMVDEFMGKGGLDGEVRYPLAFALEELFTNMVKYNPTGSGDIRVHLTLSGPELGVVLEDPDADRFDITTDAPAVDTDLPLEERTPGGLGLHLVKRMMDRVEYDHHGRVGTIRLFKRVG